MRRHSLVYADVIDFDADISGVSGLSLMKL